MFVCHSKLCQNGNKHPYWHQCSEAREFKWRAVGQQRSQATLVASAGTRHSRAVLKSLIIGRLPTDSWPNLNKSWSCSTNVGHACSRGGMLPSRGREKTPHRDGAAACSYAVGQKRWGHLNECRVSITSVFFFSWEPRTRNNVKIM